jgi:hypothetical protein
MVYTALQNNLTELVLAAEKYAAGITKIGLNGMFASTEVPLEEKASVQSRGGPSSGGGLELVVVFAGKSYILSAAGDKLGII